MKQITLTINLRDDSAFTTVYMAFLHKTVRERALGFTADFIEMNATLCDISNARRKLLKEMPADSMRKQKLFEHNELVMRRKV